MPESAETGPGDARCAPRYSSRTKHPMARPTWCISPHR